MSAWLVSKNHINVLVYWGVRLELIPPTDVDAAGRRLWLENLTSVACRYPNDRSGQRPGPTGLLDREIKTYTYSPPTSTESDRYYDAFDLENPAHVATQFECFDYQSCEHSTYSESWSYMFVREALKMLAAQSEPVPEAVADRIPWGV